SGPREDVLTADMSPTEVNRVIEPVVAAAMRGDVEGLVAAGGICALPEVRYDFPDIGRARTPIGDSLPSIQTARGAITYPTPFNVHDVEVISPSILGTWTVATDQAGTASKSAARVICPNFVTATISANY